MNDSTKKYRPIEDEHQIAVCMTKPEHYCLHLYEPGRHSGGPRKYTELWEASKAADTFALAIADRMHGDELARLRAALGEVNQMFGANDLGADLKRRIVELLSPSPVPFKPIIWEESCGRDTWMLKWGPPEQDITEWANFDAAMADFGERYAAWKERTR